MCTFIDNILINIPIDQKESLKIIENYMAI